MTATGRFSFAADAEANDPAAPRRAREGGRIEARRVGVIVDRLTVDHPWADHRWAAAQVLPGAPDRAEPWTPIAEEPGGTRYFAGVAEIVLYPGETATLKYNVEGPEPAVYVFLRASEAPPGLTLFGVTACPGEAHAHADTGDDLVEAVPMPAPLVDWVRDFVARNHVERPAYKRKRDRADPEALASRRGGPRPPAEVFGGDADDDG